MFQRIVFWEPSVSPHKADFIAAVSRELPGAEVITVADSDLLAERRAMGWTVPPPKGYRQIVKPTKSQCTEIGDENAAGSVHVFSGIRHVPTIIEGLMAVRRSGAQFGIMHEPRVAEGFRGALRFAQSWITESWLRKNAAFVLAIGRNGPPWFHSVGYAPAKVFPFAYFIDLAGLNGIPVCSRQDRLRVGYLGRLVEMKGVRHLISAVSLMPRESVHLVVGGSGEQAANLQGLTRTLGISSEFVGTIPINTVAEFMARIDILVLPSVSTSDGWGVVVSEALLAGVAVIATSCVGASIVLQDISLGACVPPASPNGIFEAIREVAGGNNLTAEARKTRQEWANAHLSATAGARSLLKILDHVAGDALRPADFFR